jgi:CheY-like chemotaxis protein
VRRILTFSRQTNTSDRAPADLGKVIRDTAALISAALPANVALALDISPRLPLVLADVGQIQQILMNLCTNGAHAIGTQPGTIRIGLESRSGRAGAAGLCLTVSDTGVGMDTATLQRVFEPFFTTKRPGEGTGLGLSIVADIVAAHEGESTVHSQPGRGTTFTIWFPEHHGAARDVTPVATNVNRQGAGQRILVVDDEPAISRVIQLALQRAGYRPVVYTSSPQAWEAFAQGPAEFQLLVIDQQMPGLSGVDFIAKARRASPTLPVIRMSGRFEREAPTPGGDAGVSHLKKPFEMAELVELVGTVLSP